MSLSSYAKELKALGLSDGQIVIALCKRDEEREAKHRARTARWRNKPANMVTSQASRDVTSVTNAKSLNGLNNRDVTSVTLARVEDNLLLKVDTGKKKERKNTSDPEFDEWYSAYPRHEGRGQALRAYHTARKKASADVLLREARAAHHRFQKPYVPLPASWLNGERWADETVNGHGPDPPKLVRFRTVEELVAEVAAEKAAMNGKGPEELPDDGREPSRADVRGEIRH